ncbi:hypothetical protein Adeg_1167 [Ammonifex degensii KC4]|uniref:Uncharacterized protein n=1 Tax=Ammonifex degensii (strain DSM 10501 / KC4) TaxID=429009 RepID=C9RDF6_AMMDK|nr:hypothetical protein Adeg_1167 [Ammonifex degensii KC4]
MIIRKGDRFRYSLYTGRTATLGDGQTSLALPQLPTKITMRNTATNANQLHTMLLATSDGRGIRVEGGQFSLSKAKQTCVLLSPPRYSLCRQKLLAPADGYLRHRLAGPAPPHGEGPHLPGLGPTAARPLPGVFRPSGGSHICRLRGNPHRRYPPPGTYREGELPHLPAAPFNPTARCCRDPGRPRQGRTAGLREKNLNPLRQRCAPARRKEQRLWC